MARRLRVVQADELIQLNDGRQVPVVTEENLIQNVLLVTQFINFAGGVMSLVVQRHPTDVPGESVTTGAVIEWKDRTDAKLQPEPATPLPAQEEETWADNLDHEGMEGPVVYPEEATGGSESRVSPVEAAVRAVAERPVTGGAGGRNADDGPPPAASAEGINDGLEVSPEAEDIEAIPAEAR